MFSHSKMKQLQQSFKFELPLSTSESFMLGVSKNSPYFSGENLRYLIELFRPVFSESMTSDESAKQTRLLMYADTLDAYNEMIRNPLLSLEEARDKLRKEGDIWLTLPEVQALLALPWTAIIRWTDLVNHPRYSDMLCEIQSWYYTHHRREEANLKILAQQGDSTAKHHLLFSERVDTIVGQRIGLFLKSSDNISSPEITSEEAVRYMRSYILEECAVELLFSEIYKLNQVLYPGSINPAMKSVHDTFSPDVMKWNRIIIPNSRKNNNHQKATSSPALSSPRSSGSSSPMFSTTASPVNFFKTPSYSRILAKKPAQEDFFQLSAAIMQQTGLINGRMTFFANVLQSAQQATKLDKPLDKETRQGIQDIIIFLQKLEETGITEPTNQPFTCHS